MRCATFLLIVATATLASACCYTLQSNPLQVKAPIYTWYLDMLSHAPVRATDCVGTLHAVDQRRGPALSSCEMISLERRPLDPSMASVDWQPVNMSEAERVVFTQPCFGFGPYRAGDRASSLLVHQLSDSWLRAQLMCDDSPFQSCVIFGFRARQATESRLVAEEQPNQWLDTCVRTPSATPSRTPTPSLTPSPTATPTATPLPDYGSVFRIEATFDSGVFVALQVGLDYTRLKASDGADGAHWCATPVLDAERTHVMTTLYADDGTDEHRRSTLSHWAAQAVQEQEAVHVTVVWSGGGFCRVTLSRDDALTFDGCRLFLGPDVHERVTWSQISVLDPRAVPLCGTVVTANQPEPSAPPAPVHCSPSLGWRIDPAHSLVTLQRGQSYGEARIGWAQCSDGSEQPRLSAVAAIDGVVALDCSVDSETLTQAHCGEQLLVAVAGTRCDSIESAMMDVMTTCAREADAVLLLLLV